MDLAHFACGSFGGVGGIVVGHPLDTLKVRMQVCKRGGACIDVIRSTIAWGGYGAFYKGITSPLAASSLITAVAFGSKANMEKYLLQRTNARSALVGSSIFAGICVAPIYCIFEFAKCQVQAGNHTSPFQCLRSTYMRSNHGVRALFPGLSLVFAREIPSTSLYFVSYDLLRYHSNFSLFTHATLGPMFSGGIAGVFAVAIVHPIDVLKSRYQILPYKTRIASVARELRQTPQWWALGLSAAILRAFVANAVVFLGYEKARKFLDSRMRDTTEL
eukprot:GEMP01034544.1.p1 GENE.GEMP01034544.1~~GEMP01034544.1.p1  ORF type:complete len:274 (+),score=42.52 GEMP01034544.1:146-967(+)